MGREYRCVECGYGVKSLFVQYSPGNIRLMKCENCKEVADEYIECEIMIIFIDLVLHKPKAYRHLLYNVLNQETINIQSASLLIHNFISQTQNDTQVLMFSLRLLWKSIVAYLLLDAYRSLLLRRADEDSGISQSPVSISTKVAIDVLLRNFAFICTFALAIRIMLRIPVDASRRRQILSGILISSYFKIFLLAMVVWEFPTSVIFIVDIFVLTSNTVALKVMTESATSRCIAVCFVAELVRILADQFTEARSVRCLEINYK